MRLFFLTTLILAFLAFWDGALGLELYLRGGDRFTGEIIGIKGENVLFKTPYGTLSIPQTEILNTEVLGAERPSDVRSWKARFSLGVELNSGNTDYQSYRAMASLMKKGRSSRLEAEALYEYALSEGSTDKDRFRGDFFFDQGLTPRLFFFTKDLLEIDREADLDLRLQGGTGLSYYLFGPGDNRLQLLFGASFDYEDYKAQGAYLVTRALLGFKGARLLGRLGLEGEVSYQPKFSQPEDYQFDGRLRLSLPILQSLQFSLRLEDIYRSRVPEGTKRNDLKILSTLDWLLEF
ncbi:DUF481 domain-containing protein [Thermosulfuriphilus sp.]